MRVETQETLRLEREELEQRDEHDVLVDVGEVARVEGVSVFHAPESAGAGCATRREGCAAVSRSAASRRKPSAPARRAGACPP